MWSANPSKGTKKLQLAKNLKSINTDGSLKQSAGVFQANLRPYYREGVHKLNESKV